MGRTSDADARLMEAAIDLIWEESYGAVTIDDICKRAGVKKGSFYYFFESKAALAIAALEKMWRDEWKPFLDDKFSSSVDPVTRIRTYLETIFCRQNEVCEKTGKVLGCPVCSLGSEISTQEADVGSKVRELITRKRRYLESAIRDAVAEGAIEPCDAAQKALALTCLIEGTVSQARIMNDPEMVRTLPTMAIDLLRVRKTPAPTVPAAGASAP